MKLIIGLGNPGKEYQKTRHNLGKTLVQNIALERETHFKKNGSSSVAPASIHGKRVILAYPQTYMNESGIAAQHLLSYYKIKAEDVILCYDELDIPFGTLRMGKFTSSAGHNGVASVMNALKSRSFIRLRLGIGPKQGPAEKYVLEQWNEDEASRLPLILKHSEQALEMLLGQGLEKTAATFNSTKSFLL